MKNKLFYIIGFALLLTSCKKYLDINDTPNNPLVGPPSVLLPNTTVGLAFANSNELGRAASVLMQYNTGIANQVAQEDIFNLDNLLDNQWSNEVYGKTIQNLRILIRDNQETSPAYSGIAKLQLAYIFSLATDLWGDVPYTQAGYGLEFQAPRFDKQEDIYQGNAALGITGLFDLVKDGIADLDKPTILKPGTKDDMVYAKTAADTVNNAHLAKWKRVGNTLLLKFALQVSNRNATLAKSTIEQVITGNNYINANAFDLEVPFGTTTGNQNPLYAFNYINRIGELMLSTRFLNLMRSLNDTVRLGKFYTRSPAGNFVSFDNGAVGTAPATANRSKYNTYLVGNNGEAPIRLLTNFQVQFILAESALILGTTGNANNYYQAGIRANMQKIGMTTAEIDNYFATNPTVVTLSGTTEEQRKQIITQKYIALTGNAIESFNDFRRTGYPVLTLPQNAAGDNPAVFPTRLPYTPNELARNPNAPNPRPKTDVKLWWAK